MRDKPGWREAYGPYDWYISKDPNGNYVASRNAGPPLTSTTPDIWALLTSIDGTVTAPVVTRIYIASGAYTGSATFAPALGKGYYLEGAGGYDLNNAAPAGQTQLQHTGTGKAFDGSTNWGSNSGNHSQQVHFYDLAFLGPATSGSLLDLTNADGWTMQRCTFWGNSTIVTGSIGIYSPSVSNDIKMVFRDNLILYFDTLMSLGVDHLAIEDCEMSLYKSYGIRITGGGSPDLHISHVHNYNAGQSTTHALVSDERSGGGTDYLYLQDVSVENNSIGVYTNVNGAPYLFLVSDIQTNSVKLIQTNIFPGLPIVVSAPATSTGLTGANTNFINYTPPATVGRYRLVWAIDTTTATTDNFTVVVTWKNAIGTARSQNSGGFDKNGTALVAGAITNTIGAGNYYGSIEFSIDNSATAITLSTAGTFTTVTYNLDAHLERIL